MKSKTFWAAAGKVLAAMTVMLIVVTTLASGASAATYKVLHKFTGGNDGAVPYNTGSLALDSDGRLYGTAWGGGLFNAGVVFKLAPNPDGKWTETVLYNFTGGEDGGAPAAGLIFDTLGILYGTATGGGAYKAGVVFQLAPNLDGSWTETVLHSFTGVDGNVPRGPLTFDAAGNLYGTTFYGGTHGCGTVFELIPNGDGTWAQEVIHDFTCGGDGAIPHGALIFDSSGSLYGTARNGGRRAETCYEDFGAPGCGLIFKLTPNGNGTWTEKVLHKFTGGKDGANPSAVGLIFDGAGNLYVPIFYGGVYGCGTVFELIPHQDGNWTHKVLHTFTCGKDGALPGSSLVWDAAGALYSTTWNGGTHNLGVVFKLSHDLDGKWREKVLHSFAGKPAGIAAAGVVFDTAGNLYGSTIGTTYGVVYEITP